MPVIICITAVVKGVDIIYLTLPKTGGILETAK
jgi:hypothetical protein